MLWESERVAIHVHITHVYSQLRIGTFRVSGATWLTGQVRTDTINIQAKTDQLFLILAMLGWIPHVENIFGRKGFYVLGLPDCCGLNFGTDWHTTATAGCWRTHFSSTCKSSFRWNREWHTVVDKVNLTIIRAVSDLFEHRNFSWCSLASRTDPHIQATFSSTFSDIGS